MKLMHVVGARPNFPKLALVHRAARDVGLEQVILHTGQHYDETLSEGFFAELEIPAPELNLEVGSGTHTAQTALAAGPSAVESRTRATATSCWPSPALSERVASGPPRCGSRFRRPRSHSPSRSG